MQSSGSPNTDALPTKPVVWIERAKTVIDVHRDFGLAEGAGQRARSAPMPMARNSGNLLALDALPSPAIARTRQHGVKLAADHLFNGLAHPLAQSRLNRIEPVI